MHKQNSLLLNMFHFRSKWVIGLLIINCLNNKLHIKSMRLLMIRSPTNHATSNGHIQQFFHSFASVCIKVRVHSITRPSASISCTCRAKQGESTDSIKPEGGYSGKPLTFQQEHIKSNLWKSKAALVLVKEDTFVHKKVRHTEP